MAESLRLVVAVLGNAASVSLYAAPMVTFKRVIRKKSTEEFSCIPYIIGLLNCLLFTWYGLPIKKVIQTKSVEFMPLPLSLCSFLATVLWLIYGLLKRDIFVAGPSAIGTPLGILQLVLYCKYRKGSAVEEPNKGDPEKGNLEKVDMEMGKVETSVTNHMNGNS
ncbi:Bidirectional sugar transporter SWEET3b [Spatholobus suberectus]|nr:Bidirectional sugar transporter SWEET3b [Spatholobus suberectus]